MPFLRIFGDFGTLHNIHYTKSSVSTKVLYTLYRMSEGESCRLSMVQVFLYKIKQNSAKLKEIVEEMVTIEQNEDGF